MDEQQIKLNPANTACGECGREFESEWESTKEALVSIDACEVCGHHPKVKCVSCSAGAELGMDDLSMGTTSTRTREICGRIEALRAYNTRLKQNEARLRVEREEWREQAHRVGVSRDRLIAYLKELNEISRELAWKVAKLRTKHREAISTVSEEAFTQAVADQDKRCSDDES